MVKVGILKLIPSLFHFICALEAPCLSYLCGGSTIPWWTPVHLHPASLFSDIVSGDYTPVISISLQSRAPHPCPLVVKVCQHTTSYAHLFFMVSKVC